MGFNSAFKRLNCVFRAIQRRISTIPFHVLTFQQRCTIIQLRILKITLCSRDSSVGIATCYGLRRSGDPIPVGARLFALVQTSPEAHPASYTMGTGYFPGSNRAGCGVHHPPLYSAKVKEKVEL